MIRYNAINPLLLHQFISKDEHGVFVLDQADLGGYREKVILNNQCLPTEQNSSVQFLVRSISKLEMASTCNGVEPQILRQVKKEARFVTSFFLTGGPSIRCIASYNLSLVLRRVDGVVGYLKENDVGQSSILIFFMLKFVEHFNQIGIVLVMLAVI